MQTSVIILYNNTSPHENTYIHETTIADLCTMFLHLNYILHYARTLIMAKDTMFATNRRGYTYKYLEQKEERVFRNGITSTNVYQMSINSKDINTKTLLSVCFKCDSRVKPADDTKFSLPLRKDS